MEAANSDNPPNSLAFVNLQDHTNIESDDNEDQNWNNYIILCILYCDKNNNNKLRYIIKL